MTDDTPNSVGVDISKAHLDVELPRGFGRNLTPTPRTVFTPGSIGESDLMLDTHAVAPVADRRRLHARPGGRPSRTRSGWSSRWPRWVG